MKTKLKNHTEHKNRKVKIIVGVGNKWKFIASKKIDKKKCNDEFDCIAKYSPTIFLLIVRFVTGLVVFGLIVCLQNKNNIYKLPYYLAANRKFDFGYLLNRNCS